MTAIRRLTAIVAAGAMCGVAEIEVK